MTDEEEREYVTLLADNQAMIRGFLISLLPGLPNVDDVIQNTNEILWTKRGNFEMGTNFKGWALTIARYQAMAHLKQAKSERWYSLEEGMAQLISEELEQSLDAKLEDRRVAALDRCLAKLGKKEKDLLLRRYWKRQKLQDFCAITGLSMANLKVKLFRLRAGLKTCIESELGASPQP